MKNAVAPSDTVLQEILVWSAFARTALASSLHPLRRSTGMHLWKQRLIRQHARHVIQLRGWLSRAATERHLSSKRPGAWGQVIHAMASSDDYVAQAACDLLERAVITAYEHAIASLQLDPAALRLVRRQVLSLENARHRARHSQPAWFDRAKRSAAAVTSSSHLGETVADPS